MVGLMVMMYLSSSKFVADAASVRQQFPAIDYADAGSVGHEDANLELLYLVMRLSLSGPLAPPPRGEGG